jgi:hypothetical protein
MVNVVREADVPASLHTAEIRQYISAAAAHIENPVNSPKPQPPGSYRTSDLLEAIDRVFKGKCYLTELKYVNSWIMDIDHFIPKNERVDLIYEWSNLFPLSHYSNMIKPRTTPEGGYLNPCDVADNVEWQIVYTLCRYGLIPNFEARDVQNVKAVNTCILLARIHNGHDENTANATAELRHAIHKRYIEILNKICEWRQHSNDSQEKLQARRELRDLLSRESSFTMLMRSIPAVRQLPQDFFD